MFIVKIFKSNYCKVVFVASFIIGYYLIPKQFFFRQYALVGLLFMLSFAFTTTCLIRNLKERVLLAKTYKTSLISIIATVIGLVAFQACGIGAPVCGASLGVGIVSLIFPRFAFSFVTTYSLYLVVFSIIAQLLSLYFMNCFKNACL